MTNLISFKINGKMCKVSGEVTSDDTLLDYIRKTLELRGTKYMCREGGCGACIVSAVKSPGAPVTAVNSCMVSVTSCKDWEITTIEKIGNKLDGYNVIQKTLAEYNGSQCGYCSPGWIMSMFSLLKERKRTMTMLEIETLMSSNICRCTGYRPILDAFKTFAKDAPKPNIGDIEELHQLCKKTRDTCKSTCEDYDWCIESKDSDISSEEKIEITLKDGKEWFRVTDYDSVFKILDEYKDKSYMLVFGNTAKGAYPLLEYPDILIDISGISQLKKNFLDQNLVIGAGVSLNEAIDILNNYSTKENFHYLKELSKHIYLIANTSIRNLASIGGNLVTKHEHHDFPSDIFLLLETIGATITIMDPKRSQKDYLLKDFLSLNIKNKILTSVKLPPLSEKEYKLVTFKIMPRSQNTIARVNAGFLYKFSEDDTTVKSASIVIGGINPDFIHAQKTEQFLAGKNIFENQTLQRAIHVLSEELVVYGYKKEYTKSKKILAQRLFYKGLLILCPKRKISDKYLSGKDNFEETRPVSHGAQVYDTNKSIWPLNKPVPKVEALIQCAGEAPYADDTPDMPGEVYANFVITTLHGDIENIDPSPALALDGVLAFYSVKDIPGRNSFMPKDFILHFTEEKLLHDDFVPFNGAPVGIIVAETEQLAERAAKLVIIRYKNIKKPILTIKEAKKDLGRVIPAFIIPAISIGSDIVKVIKGHNLIESQHHFHMEKQICVTQPSEDGIRVNSSTQWIECVQIAIANALNITNHSIDISCRRIGGSFGAKISRSTQIAVACALVTHKLKRPCRMILPLETNTRAIGKRTPSSSEFEVAVNNSGEIQKLEYHFYQDNGYVLNEALLLPFVPCLKASYDRRRFNIKAFVVLTDTASNSWCRSPGTLEMTAMMEYIMEQISYEMSLDPIDVREINLPVDKRDDPTRELIASLKKDAEYYKRRDEVKNFNQNNRWKKRGLRFVCMKWPMVLTTYYPVSISINHCDGSVVLTLGAIEVGQGLNTKAIQVCAYILNIPMEKIRVKATNNVTNPNTWLTGQSSASESVCFGIAKSCQILLDRLLPLRAKVADSKWETLIKAGHEQGISLFASYAPNSTDRLSYNVFGAALAEVEVDILTGEIQIKRVDLIEDVGQSLSPDIDVGQIEGGFIMGSGYWTCEKILYNEDTGMLLSNRTWNYEVPLARDIPVDFRVYFKRNAYNTNGMLGSKATGEPAIGMSIVVAFAIREAISASRYDSGIPTSQWFHIDGPYTLDAILENANVNIEELRFN